MSIAGKIAKGIGKKYKEGKIVRNIKKGEEESVTHYLGLRKSLTNKASAVVGAGIVGVSILPNVAKTKNAKNLGEFVDGSGLSNMSDGVELSPLITAAQQGEYDAEANMSRSMTTYGADASIVFALHNMR